MPGFWIHTCATFQWVFYSCASKPVPLHSCFEKWNLREMQVGSIDFENIVACHKMVCDKIAVWTVLYVSATMWNGGWEAEGIAGAWGAIETGIAGIDRQAQTSHFRNKEETVGMYFINMNDICSQMWLLNVLPVCEFWGCKSIEYLDLDCCLFVCDNM